MSRAALPSSHAWTVVAHAAGGALLGLAEAVRLGTGTLAVVLLPLFALTGLAAGALVAGAERIAEGLLARRTPAVAWRAEALRALAMAAPSVLVVFVVARTLFAGAYAQTLPLAGAMPLILPVLAWIGIAVAVFVGRRIVASGELTARAIGILGVAALLGSVILAKRRVLGTGYPDAHVAAAITAIVLVGVLARLARRARPSRLAAAATAGLVVGAALAAGARGLTLARDRRVLADRGDLGRDVVRLWRSILDLDRDGSSAWLGGGDCDDLDPARHPGARDVPRDGIDQDCDGEDAEPPPPPPAPPSVADLDTWRTMPAVRAVLDRTRGMNVLLVTVDALRFDLVAPDAPHREDFPRLSKLLDESVFYTRAIAPAAGTDIALSTLMSGRLDPFQTIERTLPEAIQGLGLRTSMALPSEVTRHVGEVLVGRGMDTTRTVYTDWGKANVGDHISAPTTTAEGLRAIEKAAGGRWFAWVHYFDVHEHHQLEAPAELRAAVWDGGSEAVHAYRALLLAVDRALGTLLDELAAKQLLDQTIIVFCSDHGEALGEDPRLPATHGQVTYPPLVRIPIAFRVPGVTPGTRAEPVSLVDIAPTLLQLLGAPTAMTPLDGVNLVPSLLDGPAALRPAPKRALVVHEEKQHAVVEWPYQVVVRPEDDLVELYNLETDPGFKTDLAATEPALAARLRARYAEVPEVKIDRTARGRAWRESQAQRPRTHAPP